MYWSSKLLRLSKVAKVLKKSTSYNAYYKFPPPTYPPIWSSIIWQTILDDISSCALALGFAFAFILNFAFAFALASATWSSGDPTSTHISPPFGRRKTRPSHLGLFDGSHLGFVLLPHFSSFLVDLAPGRMLGLFFKRALVWWTTVIGIQTEPEHDVLRRVSSLRLHLLFISFQLKLHIIENTACHISMEHLVKETTHDANGYANLVDAVRFVRHSCNVKPTFTRLPGWHGNKSRRHSSLIEFPTEEDGRKPAQNLSQMDFMRPQNGQIDVKMCNVK